MLQPNSTYPALKEFKERETSSRLQDQNRGDGGDGSFGSVSSKTAADPKANTENMSSVFVSKLNISVGDSQSQMDVDKSTDQMETDEPADRTSLHVEMNGESFFPDPSISQIDILEVVIFYCFVKKFNISNATSCVVINMRFYYC